MLQPIQAGSPSAVAGSTARPSAEASIIKYASNAAPVDKPTGAALAQAERKPGQAELGNAIADLNKVAQANAQGVRFSLDEDSGRTVVKVVDTQTDKVLRQIPSVEALKLWRSIEQMQGVMLRDTA
jgi:flagellar protein FlaG